MKRKQCKIALALPNLNKGGGNRSQIAIANGLIDRGYRVEIITSGPEKRAPRETTAKILKPRIAGNNKVWRYLTYLTFLGLKQKVYDIVITSFAMDLYAVGVGGARRKNLHVARHYDPLLMGREKLGSSLGVALYKALSKKAFMYAGVLTANSSWTANKISENVQCFAGQDIPILLNGLSGPFVNECVKPLRIKKDKLVISCMGRSHKWKGLPEVLSAVKTLAKNISGLKLLVITQEDLKLAPIPGVDVEVVKPVDDSELVESYKRSDIFISASWYEGFSMPPLEAMACGVLVVTTDSGGVHEYAVDGENCRVTRVGDPGDIVEAVNEILGDKSLQIKMHENGRQTAERMTWDQTVDKVEGIIMAILAARGHQGT